MESSFIKPGQTALEYYMDSKLIASFAIVGVAGIIGGLAIYYFLSNGFPFEFGKGYSVFDPYTGRKSGIRSVSTEACIREMAPFKTNPHEDLIRLSACIRSKGGILSGSGATWY